MSALDIRVYLERPTAQEDWTFRVKSWLEDIRGVSTRHQGIVGAPNCTGEMDL